MDKPEVLIIGAGPTGLMAACQLALRNIPFRIIDKTADHTTQSRALVIHARSLEILQQMGLAEEAMQRGRIAKGVNIILNGKRKLRFGLRDIGNNLTDFPFLLMLEQSKTEIILNNFLIRCGHQVERLTELILFSQNQEGVRAVIQKQDGKQETIETNWLIGADGAHSVVRKHLNIPFIGRVYQQSLFVLDCKVNMDLPLDELCATFSDQTFALFVPLTNGRCRVNGLIPKEFRNKEEITFDEVNKNFAHQTHLDVTLQDPEWIAKYNAHHRVVSAFREGRCFLTGDAAHIHSPVGGQGMNTGLQDAYNLSWKLALVIQKKAKEDLLDTYNDERIGIAKKLVRTTDKVFHVFTGESRSMKIYRLYIIPFILKLVLPFSRKTSFFKKFMFTNVSEIAIHYRNSKLSQTDDSFSYFKNNSAIAGDRVPYSLMRKDFTEGNNFHLLLFSHDQLSETLSAEFQTICNLYSGLISTNIVPYNGNTVNIYQQFGIKDTGVCLIRPDSYIAYKCLSLNSERLKNYLEKLFLPNSNQ